jgi:hypothetical protein
MTRIALLLLLLPAHALAEVNSTGSAWTFLSDRKSTLQWVIISSTKNEGYVQCENMRTVIRCPFPVWAKVLPGQARTRAAASRDTAFPEVDGARLNQYLSAERLASLKRVLARVGVKPEDAYSRMVNARGAVVGTSYDVIVVLKPTYANFDRLVSEVFREVFQTTPLDGYKYEIGRWTSS